MFDDFREIEDDGENAVAFLAELEEEVGDVRVRPPIGQTGRILGMTAPQRFVIAFMLFFVICIIGSLCLMVFGKIQPPF
ncbi:MAG: hypothetical protein OEZ02_02390 [Anaerolineae bacterium]|nr:hypothetical protein [Anaerolineae bacterium]